jgi:hypothetical protein
MTSVLGSHWSLHVRECAYAAATWAVLCGEYCMRAAPAAFLWYGPYSPNFPNAMCDIPSRFKSLGVGVIA